MAKTTNRFPRLVIAGLKGGSGKTTLSLGLVAAWRGKEKTVATYKKGPDYIDAGWLSSASGLPCYNLDPFLIGREKILQSFTRHYGDADLAVIEGNRGLYDGMDSAGTYSTAELAKTLHAPVILIVDCTKVTRTAGAMVKGMQEFDRKVPIRGVVLNRIAGARHEKIIREVVERYCGIPVLGAFPKLREDLVSERHMGLTPFQEHPEVGQAIAAARRLAEECLDLDRLEEIALQAPPLRRAGETNCPEPLSSDVNIGVIRDSAFQFYYPENFEELRSRGARLVEISALTARGLPDIDALYIGGGFPETNAIALASNRDFRRSLKRAVERGLPVYAECGGLMYLGTSLLVGGRKYPMAGIFPLSFSLEKRPQAHGYTIVRATASNPFFRRGTELRGHEFHYSRVAGKAVPQGASCAFAMKRGNGIWGGRDGMVHNNVLATYTHLHAYGAPEWADGLVRKAKWYRKRRDTHG